MVYFINRLGIPTIFQGGRSGDAPHAWNIVQMENNKWYFLDASADDKGQEATYNYFLKGQGTGGTLPGEFLRNHEIDAKMVYPECAIKDYDRPVVARITIQPPEKVAALVM
jgi:hypothetical protein